MISNFTGRILSQCALNCLDIDQIYEIERKYHDKMALNHENQWSWELHEVAPWQHIRSVMGDIRKKRILDLGCGFGRESICLAKKGADVIGIDLSEISIECAKRHAAEEGLDIEFLVSSAENLKFTSEFDIVLCRASLHHFPNVLLVTQIAYNALKSGGLFIAQEPKLLNPIAIAGRKTINKPTPTEHPFRTGELETIFREVFGEAQSQNFCILSHLHIGFSRFGHKSLSRLCFKILEPIDRVLISTRLKNYAWIEVVWAFR